MNLGKVLNTIAKILFNVAVIVFTLVMVANAITSNEAVANLLTNQVFIGSQRESVSYSTGLEPVRYKTWYSSTEDVLNGNGEIAYLAQSEGSVLLKNEGNALPLSSGEKVSLFGVTAYDPMYSQDGAGNSKINDPNAYNGSTEAYRRQYFYDEFERVGLNMNEALSDWYNSDAGMYYWRMDYVGFNGQSGSPRYRGYTSNSNGSLPALTEARWSEIGTNNMDRDNYDWSTTAIYVTGRMSNESADLNSEGAGSCGTNYNNDGVKGSTDYLAFTDDEKELLKNLKSNYKKVIIIFNQANPPQEDIPEILDEYGIDAALWIGYPGSDGIRAVADILIGKVNPSGGLSAMWYASRNANPSTQNFSTNTSSNNNVVNVEGMYVGYRYAETRYEDILLGSDGAGTYDYDTQVSYPFGYGLSYSSFTYSDLEVVPDSDPDKNYYSGGLMASNINNLNSDSSDVYTGNYRKAVPANERRATGESLGDYDDLILRVTVTNATAENGGVAGKEIVQVYLQQPVGDDDVLHHIERPSVQLVGYGKTDILQPGESQTIEIKIDANKWFAAYDAYKQNGDGTQGKYVLTAGDYQLTIARNSHEAVNSIYQANNGSISLPEAFDDSYGMGSADFVKTITVSAARSNSYSYWTQGTTDNVSNLFSDLNPNMDSGGEDTVTYFSRSNWETTAAIQSNGRIGQMATSISGASASQTNIFNSDSQIYSSNIDAYEAYYNVKFEDTEYVYGLNSNNSVFESLQLANLVGVEYDSARGASEDDIQLWADLVAKMSTEDFSTLFTQGRRRTMAIESITKPATDDQNASNGLEWAFGLGNSDKSTSGFEDKVSSNGFVNRFSQDDEIAYSTGYPCEGIRAATFNNYIGELVGQAIGEDALWSGASGLYGFGLGLQRNPYHGRMGEFYSDDSFLTGCYGGYEVKGAQSKGLYVYNKHFVLNDQETNRNTYASWLDEQTFRQIYLRPFEMAIEIGDSMNVMIAFNKVGGSWGGSNYNLMTRWLRGEAGMAGFAVSDWYPSTNVNIGYGMLAGTDLLDGVSAPSLSIGNDSRYDNCLVKSATRILYTVANSNAMNFIGDDTRVHIYEPDWYAWRTNIVTATSVVFVLCCAFLVGTTVWMVVVKYKSRKRG